MLEILFILLIRYKLSSSLATRNFHEYPSPLPLWSSYTACCQSALNASLMMSLLKLPKLSQAWRGNQGLFQFLQSNLFLWLSFNSQDSPAEEFHLSGCLPDRFDKQFLFSAYYCIHPKFIDTRADMISSDPRDKSCSLWLAKCIHSAERCSSRESLLERLVGRFTNATYVRRPNLCDYSHTKSETRSFRRGREESNYLQRSLIIWKYFH